MASAVFSFSVFIVVRDRGKDWRAFYQAVRQPLAKTLEPCIPMPQNQTSSIRKADKNMKETDWMRKMLPRHSLVAQISYAAALLSIVLSVILGYYAADISRRQIERDLGETFARRAQNIVDALDRGMFERYREIQIVATLDDIRDPRAPTAKKRAILEKLQQTFNAYAWIGICDMQGNGTVGTGKYLEGKDLSKRPWCTQGRSGPFIGDVHDALLLSKLLPNPSGEMFYLVDVAAPVKDKHDRLQGVLCGHIFWRWAEEMLDSKKAEGIDILLLSKDGLVLAGPEKSRSELSALAPATWQAITGNGTHKDALRDRWADGKQYLIGYARDAGYRDYPGLGWTAMVRQDEAAAFAPARALQQHILFAGVALGLLFTLIGAYLARRIATPISQIAHAADKIASGSLTYEGPETAGSGEVARLSHSIHTMVGKLTDEIRERKLAQDQLRLSAAVFANNSEAIVITDEDNEIVMVNDAFTRITGYAADEVLGKNPRIFSSGKMDQLFYQQLWQDYLRNDGWSGEIWNKRKNGEIYPEWLILSLVRDHTGKVTNHIAIYSDITERKREEERIQFLANHDVLTQLPNRFLLNDRLTQALAFAERNQAKVGILFIDLDHFKNINDSLGHDVGDELLKQVAARMTLCLRRTDTLARLGGDEFVAVLPEIGAEQEAAFVAEKMLESFSEPFSVRNHQLSITPSIGIGIYPDDGTAPVDLLRKADMAMYRAKDIGRNTLQFYRPEMTQHITERLQLEMDLRQAIARNQLFLAYQPKVDLMSGQVVGLEALIRWQHPVRGLVPANRLIEVAEESGLILEIGDWVLHQACMQGRLWQAQGYVAVPIAVNVSGVQFRRGQCLKRIRAILNDTGFSADLLEIEITESMLMELGAAGQKMLTELRQLGVRLALDDFGTGYSSLSRLKTFPLDCLKIDQSFIRDIGTDPNDAAIVRAVLGMAHEIGLKVVAEGVETQQQLDFLRQLRCEEYQGYLFSRPVTPQEIERHLQRA
jgi:diguanylate cyclase (GGDEF)-like protein/PAS domain S-box-containing protein